MTNIEIGNIAVRAEVQIRTSGIPKTGLSDVQAAIRRKSDNFHLDFSDGLFKASGWTTQFLACSEVTGNSALSGLYRATWDSSAIILEPGDYAFDFKSASLGIFTSEDVRFDHAIRSDKILGNKLGIASATLTIYERDGTTPFKTWALTDKDGASPVLQGTGPVNRGVPT